MSSANAWSTKYSGPTRVRVIDTGGIINQPTPAVSVRTAEQGEECKACGMITTNSQPDCRCS
jgi:hypothetical protein